MFRELHVRIMNRPRLESSTLKVLGVIEIILGVTLLASAIVALFYKEDPMIFVYPAPVLLILGALQYVFFRNGETLRPAGGMMMMFAAWWLSFIVSAIPFCLYGFSFTDSLFEGVSGFTTTGVTVMDGVSLPYGLLFWRTLIQWAGGIAVVLVFLFLIPMMGIGGKAFVNNEFAGSVTYNFSMRIKSAAGNFILIYVLLSGAEVILLSMTGMDIFEAVIMMFSTISTGGFMEGGNSVAGQSFVVQVIVLIFMFLGGTNFYLHYRALKKREFSAYKKNQEFIWTIMWFLIAAAAITVILLMNTESDVGNTVWHALFSVVSMGTTTGYLITDISVWPLAAYVVIWMVMLFGSMSGSTSGGIKIYRLLIIRSYVYNGIYKMFHPRSVRDVRVDGHSVGEDAVVSATVVIILFIVALIVSMVVLLISEPEMTIAESIGLSISALSNTGVDTSRVAIADLSGVSKMFLSFMMWVGRLEVVLALLLFTKTFWNDLISDLKGSLNKAGERKS